MTVDGVPREIELKLRTSREAMEQIKESAVLHQHTRSVGPGRRLVSVYYDTPDWRLATHGLALRVRRVGRRHIQTLKADKALDGLVSDHGEWEVEVPAGAPDLEAFGDGALLEKLGVLLEGSLEPVFTTRIKRDTVLVEWPEERGAPALIEVAFDEGRIEASGGKLPVVEVELELKEGGVESLFALADAFRRIAPLALETRNKSARGYALATGTPAKAEKAPRLSLASDVSVEDGVALTFRHCLAHWMRNEAAAFDGSDIEGVHQLRVSLRRLRSALSLFKGMIGAQAFETWRSELRWLQGELGPARDLDVFLGETVPAFRDRGTGPSMEGKTAEGLQALIAGAEAARDDAYRQVQSALDSLRYQDLLLSLASWVERRGWRGEVDVDVLVALRAPLRDFAIETLSARQKEVRKRGKGFADLDAQGRHKVRIALKKLRYGVEFFASLFAQKKGLRYAKRLSSFQDRLGHLNDAAVAEKLVLRLVERLDTGAARDQALLAGGALIGWFAANVSAMEKGTIKSWKTFKDAESFWLEST